MVMEKSETKKKGLSISHLKVAIKGKSVLNDLTLDFPMGKRTAIIGPNGAGKSTFLKALAGLNGSYGGKIYLDGEEICSMGRQRLAQKLAILPQGLAAPPDTKVETLVGYGRFPYRSWHGGSMDARADREAVEWALSVTKLEPFKERQVMTLSGGERQRAWIAMALCQQPKILLLDEPTTYLDIAHQLEVMNLVEAVNREFHMTVVMVLHDINHALRYADELVVIKEGGLVAQGSPDRILTVELIQEVFGVRADIFKNSQGTAVLSPVELYLPSVDKR